ncbi:hypothetical protein [Mycolicibacterium sphagni]|uniref:Uncharacterized protein n=1 Tax=Mycolicibacterium sphagni TaxID=1786 RepID=A0A255DX22_9MYCO|nr:hypothetical protein [Mycolicibacterium sphagni]OYN81622.1 hypothetical protein CG716_04435 [Mycolicibacterium sphagni]
MDSGQRSGEAATAQPETLAVPDWAHLVDELLVARATRRKAIVDARLALARTLTGSRITLRRRIVRGVGHVIAGT